MWKPDYLVALVFRFYKEKEKIEKILKENEDEIKQDAVETIKECLVQSFLEIKDDLLKTTIEVASSGTTANIIFLMKSRLFCANLGDSRAVLGKRVGSTWFNQALSFDHKPDNPKELERITKCNGRVEPSISMLTSKVIFIARQIPLENIPARSDYDWKICKSLALRSLDLSVILLELR